MKNKKIILIILGACVVFGIIYAASELLPENEAKIVLIGVAVVFVILWMIFKMIQMFRLNKDVSGPTHLLFEEKDPAKYVQEMETILEQVNGKQQKDLVRINISAGQLYNGDYQEAISTLEKVALPGQPVTNQLICYANQIMAYFLSGDKEKGLAVVEEQRKLLKKYDNTASGITNNVLVVYAFEFLAKGEYEQALATLEKLETRKVSSILQDIVDYLKCECYRNLKRESEKNALKNTMLQGKLVPAIRMKLEK